MKDLPEETLVFLLGSRYCETDLLSPVAWQLFGASQRGWPLVQAICDYVHNRITFDYQSARSTRTAWEAYNERTGVCRDYAHLAIAFCRCMNIPARYCTGYLGDIGPRRHTVSRILPHGWKSISAADGTFSTLGTTCQDRASADRARPRRGRCRDRNHIRPQHAGEFQGLDRRNCGERRRGSRLKAAANA